MSRDEIFGSVVGICVVSLFAMLLLPFYTGNTMLDWAVILVHLGLALALFACIFAQLF